MSECLCVNLDKEEYVRMGNLPKDSYVGSSACGSIEYYLANEWSGDRILFAFEKMRNFDFSTDETATLYQNALDFFEERNVLNMTPNYKYVVNLSKGEYFSKDDIPEGDDGTFLNPLSLLLSACKDKTAIGLKTNTDEDKNIGIWADDSITAVNNVSGFTGFKLIKPEFKCEKPLKIGSISGYHFVVTGTLSGHDRYDAERYIESKGGIVQQSVTKKTDYLVVGTKPGKVKLDKASRYGIKTLTEKEFFEMAEGE